MYDNPFWYHYTNPDAVIPGTDGIKVSSLAYNAKLRSAEILYTEEGKARQIRRAERPEDYFATLYGFDFEEESEK